MGDIGRETGAAAEQPLGPYSPARGAVGEPPDPQVVGARDLPQAHRQRRERIQHVGVGQRQEEGPDDEPDQRGHEGLREPRYVGGGRVSTASMSRHTPEGRERGREQCDEEQQAGSAKLGAYLNEAVMRGLPTHAQATLPELGLWGDRALGHLEVADADAEHGTTREVAETALPDLEAALI